MFCFIFYTDQAPKDNRDHLDKIRIAILNQSTSLFDTPTSNLQQTDFTATTELNATNLSAWLANHGIDVLTLPPPNQHKRRFTDFINTTTPQTFNNNEQAHWKLDASQLELIPPDGNPVPLSHNECCVLRAAANAAGKLVSRKMLIEALGQDFRHYDERRLESLISRLRRKLACYDSAGFPIRGIKGQGYLFGVELLAVESP